PEDIRDHMEVAKRRYMKAEHGEAWDVMSEIKRALDPRGLMNPGKVIDVDYSSSASAGDICD
ncbi:MAG: FAD-linked oxidase C-terminal domain-containing protein, partial [Wenzhouxiangella sp.]